MIQPTHHPLGQIVFENGSEHFIPEEYQGHKITRCPDGIAQVAFTQTVTAKPKRKGKVADV